MDGANVGAGSGSTIDQSVMTNFDDLIKNLDLENEISKQLGITDSQSQADQTQTVDKEIVMEFPKPEPPKDDAPTDLSQLSMWASDTNQNSYEAILSDKFEKVAAGPPPMSVEQKNALTFGLKYGPDAPVDKNTAELMDLVMEMVKEEIANSGADIPLPAPADFKKFKDNLGKIASALFETNVKAAVKDGKITQDQANQLIFGRNMPEFANPALKGLMQQFEDSTMSQLNESQGVPLNTQLNPDSSAFAKDLSAKFSALVDGNLDKLAKELGLTDNQLAQLKFMHAHAEVDFPGKSELQGTLNKAETAAIQTMQKDSGLPTNFKPAPNTQLFDSISQGFFNDDLSSQVENFLKSDPNVTDSNILVTRNLINFALKNPGNPGIPPEIQAIAQQLIGVSWGKVGGQLGVPPGTLPPPSTAPLTGGTIDPSQAAQMRNGLSIVDQQMKAANSLAISMPEGPAKGQLLNFLKTLSDALSALKEFQFTMESTDAQLSKEQAMSKLDQKLQQLDFEKIQMDKMKDKMEKMGIVTTALDVIMAVVTVLMCIPFLQMLASALMAMAVAMVVSAAVGESAIQSVVNGIKAAVKVVMDAIKEFIQKFIIENVRKMMERGVLQHLVLRQLELMKQGMMAAITGAVQGAANIAKGAGQAAVQATQQSLRASLQAIAESIQAAVKSIGNFMQLAAKSNSASYAEASAARAEMNVILEYMNTQMQVYIAQMEFFLVAVEGAMMIEKSTIQIDIVRTQAKVDSTREEVEALIKIMQEAIDALLDGLSGIAKDANDVTALLSDIYQKQSAALTQLTQA